MGIAEDALAKIVQRTVEPDERGLQKLRAQNKLTARERIALLLRAGWRDLSHEDTI